MPFTNTRFTILCTLALAFAGGCASSKGSALKEADQRFAQGQMLESRSQLDEAAVEYEKALKSNPNHVKAMEAVAHLYTRQQNYDDAIAMWRRYVKAMNGTADAYNNLAYCQDLAGWYAQAEHSYERAIEADPRHLYARVNFGLMLARHGRGTEGLCHLQCVLTPAEARYNLGLAYEEVGNTSAAQKEFRKAVEIDPDFGDAKAHIIPYEGSTRIDME
jgi:tetratricopeptide (TPR) repeat protein